MSGFRFADPAGKFDELPRKAAYVYWRREYRRSIHRCAVTRFVEDVLRPLGYHYERTCQFVKRRRVQILKVTRERNCILLILRNWVNPVTNGEIEFLTTALHSAACKLRQRDEYDHIWSFIMCQELEAGQTKLSRFGAINFYKLPYLVSPELLRFFEQKSGINYEAAYPSMSNWSGDTLTGLYGKLRRLLDYVQPENRRVSEPLRARTNEETAHGTRFELNSNSKRALALYDSSTHIVPIMTAPVKTTDEGTEGQPSDPPRVRKPPPPSASLTKRQDRIGALANYALALGLRSNDPNLPRILMKEAVLAWGIQQRTARDYVEVVIIKLRRYEDAKGFDEEGNLV